MGQTLRQTLHFVHLSGSLCNQTRESLLNSAMYAPMGQTRHQNMRVEKLVIRKNTSMKVATAGRGVDGLMRPVMSCSTMKNPFAGQIWQKGRV